jgi:Zn-dependent M28 family amino/carboxypeptidase
MVVWNRRLTEWVQLTESELVFAGYGVSAPEVGWGYNLQDYHQVTDDFRADWDLTGMAQDVRLFFETGRRMADTHQWPNWREGNEFRPIRDASRGE